MTKTVHFGLFFILFRSKKEEKMRFQRETSGKNREKERTTTQTQETKQPTI
jgi:hypothetical protein